MRSLNSKEGDARFPIKNTLVKCAIATSASGILMRYSNWVDF